MTRRVNGERSADRTLHGWAFLDLGSCDWLPGWMTLVRGRSGRSCRSGERFAGSMEATMVMLVIVPVCQRAAGNFASVNLRPKYRVRRGKK